MPAKALAMEQAIIMGQVIDLATLTKGEEIIIAGDLTIMEVVVIATEVQVTFLTSVVVHPQLHFPQF